MYCDGRTSFDGRVPGPGIRVCSRVFRPFVSLVADLRCAVLRSGLAAGVRIAAGMLLVVDRDLSVLQSSVQFAAGRLYRAAGVWRADFRAGILESVAKTILGLVLVEFRDAIYAGHYRILFCTCLRCL